VSSTLGSHNPKKSKKKDKNKQSDGLDGRQGVSKNDLQAIRTIISFLAGKPSYEDKLSSLCGRFHTNKKTITKFYDVLSLREVDRQEMMVKLVGHGNGWASWEEPRSRGKGGGSKSKGSSGGNASSPKGGGGKGSSPKGGQALDNRIDRLCRTPEIACRPSDFDNRVRMWLFRFDQRRGGTNLEFAFEVLAEWCVKKERDQVRSWPSYLMVLLRNWERNQFEGGGDED